MGRICSAQELRTFVDQLKRKIETQPSSEAIMELDTALEELKIAEETVHEQTEALGKALERADAQLRRYVELFEFAPDGYCVTDARGVIRSEPGDVPAAWIMGSGYCRQTAPCLHTTGPSTRGEEFYLKSLTASC